MNDLNFYLSIDGKFYEVKSKGRETSSIITIPEKYNNMPVKRLMEEAFCGCSNVTDIEIPNCISSIGKDAFKFCRLLKVIKFNGTANEWLAIAKDPEWIRFSANFSHIKCNDGNVTKDDVIVRNLQYWLSETRDHIIVGGIGEVIETDIEIPETYQGYPVTEIDSRAFRGSNITSVKITRNITSISSFAFSNCEFLTKVEYGGTIEEWNNISKNVSWRASSYPTVFCKDGSISPLGVIVKNEDNLTFELSSDGNHYILTRCNMDIETLNIPEKYLSLPVSEIGERAFSSRKRMKSVSIPYSVSKIGNSAFYMCEKLNDIILPDALTYLGEGAFGYCENLPSITIPNGITSIKRRTFCYCKKLIEVILPDTITSIDESAFISCVELKNINIPFAVTTIGDSAFSFCDNLVSVELPDGLISIGNQAFLQCKKLKNINIPSTVTTIGDSAFSFCESIVSVTVPDIIYKIGDKLFSYCKKMENIYLPHNLTAIGVEAFQGCESLTSIEIPKGVTSIGEGAFGSCKRLTSIKIPDGVTMIDKETFDYCQGLRQIIIPDKVTSIGYRSFSACTNLISITLGKNLKSIGADAFYLSESLYEIYNLSSLPIKLDDKPNDYGGIHKFAKVIHTSKSSPSILKMIDNEFLYYIFDKKCHFIAYIGKKADITLPTMEGFDEYIIESFSFSGNLTLKSIVFPRGVTSIKDEFIKDCEQLRTINLPSSLYYAEVKAFYDCDDLKTINFEGTICDWKRLDVNIYGFSKVIINCLDGIIDNNKNSTKKEIGLDYFLSKNGKYLLVAGVGDMHNNADIVIPKTYLNLPVKSIASFTFESCKNINNVTIEEGIEKINSYAFKDCVNLTTISIPKTVTSFESNSFYDCTSLKKIIFKGTTFEWNTINKAEYWDYNTDEYEVVCNNGTIKKAN